MTRFACALLVLLLAGPAFATPPDYLASEASPICWGGDRAAFLPWMDQPPKLEPRRADLHPG